MRFISLMRALATLLVIHSHCDELLPVPALATGGSIGDSFFFAVSGFTLFRSVDMAFGKYLHRRLSRIYPSVIFVTLMIILVSPTYAALAGMCNLQHFSFRQMVHSFIYPTCYPFLAALIIYYLLYYGILHIGKYPKGSLLMAAFAAVAVFYALYYIFFLDRTKFTIEDFPIKYLYWFGTFLMGGGIRAHYRFLSEWGKNRKKLLGFLSAALFFFFYILKIALPKLSMLNLQFVVHIVELAFLVSFMTWMVGMEDDLAKCSKTVLWRTIDFLGSITLENYLLMDFVIWLMYNSKLRFPYTWILVFPITFVSAKLVKLLSGKAVGLLQRKERT